eukprot:GHVU01083893.1.p1 GENE.GHVU01083893.1~~GHVU01083893.1.p1  ORF type:complete len:108 (+),score=0.03 GHVU01083893.1:257-580(+)
MSAPHCTVRIFGSACECVRVSPSECNRCVGAGVCMCVCMSACVWMWGVCMYVCVCVCVCACTIYKWVRSDQILPRVQWYSRGSLTEVSLGSLVVLVMLRVMSWLVRQ